ncbi:Gfo/Idh/MocA family oxidoreductase [Fulvivirga maritima]|uniref:Gfo/Idh/MocA family protein n=1 Tax=Fulvivirga maritima TaxID=2904247 RepID=UPI001F1E3A1B|nr:Gfo/Idh/MocA family oxidoreductase [Fulvivirga maritima]UII25481.1 Gfo/Idh/MocA family oxidoreductase [Fulvivirga maritima]
MKKTSENRRNFIIKSSMAAGALSLGSSYLLSCSGKNKPAESTTEKAPATKESLGIALVGLGSYATYQLAPALQKTENCHLAGIVTGTPSKEEVWMKKYDIPKANVYNYENYDEIANNDDIDIIYVVLPNFMHAEYTIRAAKAGKHVICEKPMAISVEECEQMIAACKENDVHLSIGYRLHFDPYNLKVSELGQKEVYGKVKKITGAHSFKLNDPHAWRAKQDLAGGGPLMDIGIYVLQGALYTMGKNPIEVSAKYGEVTRPDIFKDVEQSIDFTLKFPGGATADATTSYYDSGNFLRAEAEKGWWELKPAYSYSGIKGETSDEKLTYPPINQQALQMDDFAKCVMNNEKSKVPGEMGLRDMKIITSIYESADKKEPVKLVW